MGGATHSLYDYLAAIGDSIIPLVVLPATGLAERKMSDLGIECYIIPFKNGYGRIGNHTSHDAGINYLDNYSAAVKIAELVKKEKIDIIHSNSIVVNVGAMAAVIANVPHVWHVREFLEEDFGCELWDKELKINLLSTANRIISISDCVKVKFKAKYGLESIHIYDGISVNDMKKTDEDRHNNEFLFAGALSENKGQIDAVRAVNELIKREIDVKLYIIGDGAAKYRWILNRYIEINDLSDNIEMLPYNDDLSYWRNRCEFAIIGSKMEALGRVTVEAMASGILPIGTDSGGTAELIGADGYRGLLYKFGNYIQLAEKMMYAMNLSEEDKLNMSLRAKDFAGEQFIADKYAWKIYDVYENVISEDDKTDNRKIILETLKRRYDIASSTSVETGKSKNYSMIRTEIKKNLDKVTRFCKENNITKVMIYGMGDIGCTLYDILEDNNIEIVGVMDRDSKYLDLVTNIIDVENKIENVDCIFVSLIKDEQDVLENLKSVYNKKVIGVVSFIKNIMETR